MSASFLSGESTQGAAGWEVTHVLLEHSGDGCDRHFGRVRWWEREGVERAAARNWKRVAGAVFSGLYHPQYHRLSCHLSIWGY